MSDNALKDNGGRYICWTNTHCALIALSWHVNPHSTGLCIEKYARLFDDPETSPLYFENARSSSLRMLWGDKNGASLRTGSPFCDVYFEDKDVSYDVCYTNTILPAAWKRLLLPRRACPP